MHAVLVQNRLYTCIRVAYTSECKTNREPAPPPKIGHLYYGVIIGSEVTHLSGSIGMQLYITSRGIVHSNYVQLSCRGDVQRPDDKGRRPLHIAATYGHLQAVEYLLQNGANLYSLDDFGRTATKAAAFHNKTACCRYLDTLSVKWEIQNRDFVMKQQRKALQNLRKRSEMNAREGSTAKPKQQYSYATAPASSVSPLRNNKPRPSSGGPRRKKVSAQDAVRQNFELRASCSVTNVGEEQRQKRVTEDDEMRSGSLTEFGSNSTAIAFRPALNQGPMLNSLSQLPFKIEPPEELAPESGFHSNASSSASDVELPEPGRRGYLPQLELVQSHTASNDSSLATFLSALDLDDCLPQFKKEKLDLEALALCSESDLVGIGLPLGPRKKILSAIERRKELFSNAGKMTDTEL